MEDDEDGIDLRGLAWDAIEHADDRLRRLARALHEGLGQHLLGVSHLMQALARRLEEHGAAAEARAARRILDVLTDAQAQARALARELYPLVDPRAGLSAALRSMGQSLSALPGVACCTVTSRGDVEVTDGPARCLYDMAREASLDAVIHAGATQLEIQLAPLADGGVRLEVADDGLAGLASREQGRGLQAIRQRARELGASLTVEAPASDRPARLRCVVPGDRLSPRSEKASRGAGENN